MSDLVDLLAAVQSLDSFTIVTMLPAQALHQSREEGELVLTRMIVHMVREAVRQHPETELRLEMRAGGQQLAGKKMIATRVVEELGETAIIRHLSLHAQVVNESLIDLQGVQHLSLLQCTWTDAGSNAQSSSETQISLPELLALRIDGYDRDVTSFLELLAPPRGLPSLTSLDVTIRNSFANEAFPPISLPSKMKHVCTDSHIVLQEVLPKLGRELKSLSLFALCRNVRGKEAGWDMRKVWWKASDRPFDPTSVKEGYERIKTYV